MKAAKIVLTPWVLPLVVMICFFPGTSKADAIVTVGGTTYDITIITGTFNANSAQLESTPWWFDQSLSTQLAEAVGASLAGLGTPPLGTTAGPLFAFNVDHLPPVPPVPQVYSEMWQQGVGGVSGSAPDTSIENYAVVATPVATPEPNALALMFSGLLVMALLVGVKRYLGSRLATEA